MIFTLLFISGFFGKTETAVTVPRTKQKFTNLFMPESGVFRGVVFSFERIKDDFFNILNLRKGAA